MTKKLFPMVAVAIFSLGASFMARAETTGSEVPENWQDEIAGIATLAEEQYPQDFTTSTIDTDKVKGAVYFKAEIPREIAKKAARLPYLELVGDTGISNLEAQDIHHEIADKIHQENPDLKFGSFVDFKKRTVEIELDSSQAQERMSNSIAEIANKHYGKLKLNIKYAIKSKSTLDALYGGGFMNKCTSAFSVESEYFNFGNALLTAGHCNTSQSYQSIPLTYEGNYVGERGDFAVYSTTAYTAPQYYSKPGHLVNVTATRNPAVGQALCRNGMTTGQECGQRVVVNEYCDYTEKPRVCGLTVMNSRLARRGDSGGSWFSSTYAYGIHSRALLYDNSARDAFTPVRAAEKYLNVKVKTV